MLGYLLMNFRMARDSMFNYVLFKKKHVQVGLQARIRGQLKVFGNGTLTIGNKCILNSAFQYNPIGGGSEHILFNTGKEGKIIIGNNVGISLSSFVAFNEIIVEDNCMIGANCKIYDSDFHSIRYEDRLSENDDGFYIKPVRLKEGCFIGGHSIILKGVVIGSRSIVGAGSVVTKSIPDNEVWAGNPAHFIRKLE